MNFTRSLRNEAQCLVKLTNCTLKQSLNGPDTIFRNPIGHFEVYEPNTAKFPSKYAVIGHSKTEFLNALAMKYLAVPPLSRQYPYLAQTKRYDVIQHLNFRESSGLDKVYLSARYESYAYKGALEMSDDVNSVRNYITGNNNYNKNQEPILEQEVDKIIELFNLSHLSHKWINTLSNGQMRRARIAKSLLSKPKLLIVDDPFLGLDPKQTELVSNSLNAIVNEFEMSVVLGLRFQDKVPEWIGHVAEVDKLGLILNGPRDEVLPQISQEITENEIPANRNLQLSEVTNEQVALGAEPYIEFMNASVVYKDLPILTNFNWTIPKGTNWRILGENGTGKTTILSLITADHPQSWRSVLKVDGTLRKSGCGVTFFDVNNRIGMSSPELHSLVPGNKSMNAIIRNGLVKDIGISNFQFQGNSLPLPSEKIQKILEKPFVKEILEEYGETPFNQLSITHQKFTLFMRAIIKDPELIILDEAFSCMDNLQLMKGCHQILEQEFKTSTILSIGHIEWEIPHYDYVIHLLGDKKRNYKLFKTHPHQ